MLPSERRDTTRLKVSKDMMKMVGSLLYGFTVELNLTNIRAESLELQANFHAKLDYHVVAE